MNALSGSPVLLLSMAVGITAIALIIMALFVFLMVRHSQRMTHYNFELQRAALSADREFYERQLAKTALQMTASEDRWRDANHLLLSERNLRGDNKPDIASFMARFGIPSSNLEVDRRLVMILTPFSEEEGKTFEVIKDACSRIGLIPVRGDQQFISGDILTHVVRLILKSRLVIANISTRNANVFYELGIAHAMNKPTILVSKSLNDTPFDLKSNLIIVYRDNDELRNKLTESVARVMAEIGSSGEKGLGSKES